MFLIRIVFAAMLLVASTGAAMAADKVTVLLDWFVNPNQAPLFVAKYIGAYEKYGLDVELIPPADPNLPPRLLAAGKADLAISYQIQLSILRDQGLPLKRVATLIDTPLNSLTTISSTGIESLADFKGKKIGVSISGVENALVSAMIGTAGLSLDDVELINVNFQNVPALMAKRVDGAIGSYRNFEVTELKSRGLTPVVFYPEENGVPIYDELIVLANDDNIDNPKIVRFVKAMQEATIYLLNHPDEMWEAFIAEFPELDNDLNKTAWQLTQPRYAKNPFLLDTQRYDEMQKFLVEKGVIDKPQKVEEIAVELPH
ncbi:ABC transporter substrate-binding protein [Methyloligella sp. 2.7D]|uniref:ABC transporter substrate-binding protein n=1 Tax=unclassified Methyloligella TaxID=2625955 RepID=UPI00157DCB68|nr:ABC transporter substrate-binding protein [Methyloligella sp. GL2]QKP77156.1 ABC transporter substrate-binding protein [Methyloligella sp. GL2]